MNTAVYGEGALPEGVASRIVHGVNGLDVHVLEGGHKSSGRPLALLLHGFPDLAYGWRHVIPILADAGYHVVAPDQRGYGLTTGWVNSYDTPLEPFGILNMARDALALLTALGYRQAGMLVGHDIGSPIAAYCALARPDVFSSVVLMSAPFPGVPAFPFNIADIEQPTVQLDTQSQKLAAALATLDPPRQHYQHYMSTRQANEDMWHPPEGLHTFLRTFFHVKSGDWPGNEPHPLQAPTADELARMPTYYVMNLGDTMPQAVAPFRPSDTQTHECKWLTEAELGIYVQEYGRTGFQGALQAYRIYADPRLTAELRLFSGRTIDVPSLFVGGRRDWGPYSAPAALEAMQAGAATRMADIELIEGAGHWIQQEQPDRLGAILLDFAKNAGVSPQRRG